MQEIPDGKDGVHTDENKQLASLKKTFKHVNTFYAFLKFKHPYINSLSFRFLKFNLIKQLKREITVEEIQQIVYILNYVPNSTSTATKTINNANEKLIKKVAMFQYISKDQFELENMSMAGSATNQSVNGDIFKLKDDSGEEIDISEILVLRLKQNKATTMDVLKQYIKHRETIFNKNLQTLLESHGLPQLIEILKNVLLPKPTVHVDPIEQMMKKSKNRKRKFEGDAEEGAEYDENKDRIESFIHDYLHPKIVHEVPKSDPQYDSIEFLPSIIQELLHPIDKLYTHQYQAISSILHDENVMVTTSTSSGKSLIYQISTLLQLIQSTKACIIYISPTKALAQDQKRSFQNFLSKLHQLPNIHQDPIFNQYLKNLEVATYDGDTPVEERRRIRLNHNIRVIFTNPDMLHTSILPNHLLWKRVLSHLKIVILDELHIYNGLFGTHVSFVMRRMNRLLKYYAANNKFIGCSATLKNPYNAFVELTGCSDVTIIDKDGSPRGLKNVVVWNPDPVTTTSSMKYKRDFIGESANIIVQLMRRDIKTIAFCFVRRLCELLMKEVRKILQNNDERGDVELLQDVVAYRGGYSPEDRRKIEKELFHGNLKCCISTNALELGVDIGELDCVLMCGFPVSLGNFYQQSGRAGRRMNDSMTIVVASDSPVDQHYATHSEQLVRIDPKNLQDLVIDLNNSLVLTSHLQCAAFEFPIDLEKDHEFFPCDNFRSIVENKLSFNGTSNKDKNLNGTYTCDIRFLPWPAQNISLRGAQEDMFAVVDITNGRNMVIEEIEASRTSFTLYDGSIFIHQGLSYIVKEFNADIHYAKVLRTDVEYTTSQRDFTDVDPVEIEMIRSLGKESDVPVYFGKIKTTIKVFGYFKIDKFGKVIDAVETYNPAIHLFSKGLWIDIPKRAMDIVEQKNLCMSAGVHAAQHCLISCLPQYIVAGVDEVQTECKAPEKEFAGRQTARVRPARLVFYDSRGGSYGSGLSIKAFEHIDEVLNQCLEKLQECDCKIGCPNCGAAVPFCKESNLVISKSACMVIIAVLLGKDTEEFIDGVEDGPEENLPEIKVETVKPIDDHVKFAPDFKIVNI